MRSFLSNRFALFLKTEIRIKIRSLVIKRNGQNINYFADKTYARIRPRSDHRLFRRDASAR